MTKRAETNSHVMLNLFQHLVYFFSAFSRRTFHPRPQDGVFRCGLNKYVGNYIPEHTVLDTSTIRKVQEILEIK